MTYKVNEIAQIIGAQRYGFNTNPISWLLTDSRSLCFPKETVFFAIKGPRQDGHSYIRELYTRGVRNFVVTALPDRMEDYPDANFLLVRNTIQALQSLASAHRQKFQVPVVGITGSNGKTIIKEWLYQLLASDYSITRSPRSYNSQIGVPLSVWLMNPQTTLGIFEAGISEPGEMRALWKIIRPTIGILSNVGLAHQVSFSSMQEKCIEKLKLFADCDMVIYDADNELIQSCVNKTVITAHEIAWSRKNPEKPLFIKKIEKLTDTTRIDYRYIGMENSFTIPFVDDASIENAIHCLAVCLYMMVPPEEIAARMAQLEPLAMRLEVKDGKRGCLIINDSYNSDILSLDIALDFMQRRGAEKPWAKKTLIVSDIFQTGMTVRSLYRNINQLIEGRGIDKLIGIGPDISSVYKAFNVPEMHFYESTQEFLKSPELEEIRNELVLIKGSRRFNFDQISDQLELKVHETILEVDLHALSQNLDRYRSMLKPETKIVCMVKAGAYGSGSIEVAKTLHEKKVNYLAVAVADEGFELRRAGITTNIMVMNPERTSFKTMFDYKLEPEIYSFHLLEEIIRAAEHEGITNFPVHIKVDTGMHRLGFAPDDIPALIERLKKQTSLIPRSVFSHFVGSDSDSFDDFSHQQVERFNQAADLLCSSFKHRILKHICNSAGIERFPQYHFDMVRLGLGLYGINPIDNSQMDMVCTLKTTILQIRHVSAGDTVGYSRKQKLSKESRIAALPIGYADGLDRLLGNGNAYCMVNGQKAYYVGNICMDVCMIDVTDIPCKEGDRVEIFGKNLPVSNLSNQIGTIPYEIISTVSTRVKRVYYSE